MRRIPGAKPASKTPTTVLSATSWPYVCTKDMQHVAMPHSVMITGRKIDGLVLDRMRLDGTSNRTYVMTVIQLAILDRQHVASMRTEDDQGD
jgi:hypothetical protein